MTNDKYNVNDIFNELNEVARVCLTEVDFYPPSDNRVWKSGVKDIYGGDNFGDYCEYIFGLLDEEEYYQ